MAGKTTGTETPPAAAATANADASVTPVVDPTSQESIVIKQLEETQASIKELQAVTDRLTRERNDAVAARLQADAQYKGLQNQTTKTLQKAAEDRKALEQAKIDKIELAQIKETLETLTTHLLGDEEKAQLQFRQRELQLKLREEAMAAKAIAPVEELVTTPQQYVTPEDEKAQFLSYYFPGVQIDPKNPDIDWGDGAANTQEAFRRFTTSVLKVKDAQDQVKQNDAISVLQEQAKEQLAAMKKQQDELATKTAEEISAAKTEAVELARKEAEKRLRAMGADVTGTPPSDGGRKTLEQQMNEQLDENLLRTKEGRKEYDRRAEAINKQVRERFQRLT